MDTARTMQTIVTPAPEAFPYGRWAPIVKELINMGPELSKRISPPLKAGERTSLRAAARWLKRRIHIRTTPECTVVWIGAEMGE